MKHRAQNCGFGANLWKKKSPLRNRDRHFHHETAENKTKNMEVKNYREKASCKIKGQKALATKALLWLALIGDDLFRRKCCAINRIVMILFCLFWLNQHAGRCFLEGFLEGTLQVPRQVLRRECFILDIFENPYGAPRPTGPQNPPATKKEIPKNPENADYPQK